ncbi:MAG: DUF4282 domain-containing protein [Bacillota bacterium]
MSKERWEYPDGSRYEGEMIDGKREGEGTWVRPDGSKYTGQWKNDKPDGIGTFIWPDGRKFKGYWKSGKRHGKGIEILPDGKRIEGEWEEGELKQDKSASVEQESKEKEAPTKEIPQTQKASQRKDEFDTESLQEQGKSFFTALFDVSFSEMVTPKIIRTIFIIGLIAIALGALGGIISSVFAVATTGVSALVSIIAVPIGAIIGVIFLRIYMELIILLFNIYDQLKSINDSLRR